MTTTNTPAEAPENQSPPQGQQPSPQVHNPVITPNRRQDKTQQR